MRYFGYFYLLNDHVRNKARKPMQFYKGAPFSNTALANLSKFTGDSQG